MVAEDDIFYIHPHKHQSNTESNQLFFDVVADDPLKHQSNTDSNQLLF